MRAAAGPQRRRLLVLRLLKFIRCRTSNGQRSFNGRRICRAFCNGRRIAAFCRAIRFRSAVEFRTRVLAFTWQIMPPRLAAASYVFLLAARFA